MNILAYRTIPVTVLIATIYILIFLALYQTNSVPGIPEDTHGLDLQQAYVDLHHITTLPHPYHSHANDVVRLYILSRLDEITSECDYAHVEEDSGSKAFWLDPSFGAVIFQPSNILVKIDGHDDTFSDTGGVLFSAHYDSVSTGFGVTDDGIGVVSLLQLVEHLVKNRPRRTAIFNINNGEEDGLHGAQAFLRHPWSNIPDTFINLEGAGAGGPPLLFRATSLDPVKAYGADFTTNSTTYRVSHPHGNVLSADAFQRGVVRSRTDYSIYNSESAQKMEGIDLAFYKRRSRYHTMFDSIPGTKGQAKESLWAMLESAWATGGVLLNLDSPAANGKPPVYFDLFKKWFFVFEQETLHIFNLTFLLGGPVLVLFLHVALPFFYGHFDTNVEEKPSLLSRVFAPVLRLVRSDSGQSDDSSEVEGAWPTIKSVFGTATTHVRNSFIQTNIWIPIVLFLPSKLFIFLITTVTLKANGYITYSHPYTVTLSYISIILILITFLLGSPVISAKLRGSRPNVVYVLPDRQATLLHLYVFTYLLLVLAALALWKFQIGGLYWISAWHGGVCTACIIGGVETFYARLQRVKEHKKKKRRSILRRDVRDASRSGRNSRNSFRRGGNSSDSDDDAVETTPLLPGSATLPDQNGEFAPDAPMDKGLWWIFQVLLSIPVPVMLIGHILFLFQGTLGQTLSDGSNATFVYVATAVLCFFIVLPIAPFAFGIHRYVTYLAIITFVACFVFNLTAFPFSQETPLKVLFRQSVQLNGTNQAVSGADVAAGQVVRAVTSLTGVQEFLQNGLVSQLPSSWDQDVQCSTDTSGRWVGLVTCSWESDLETIPYPGGTSKHPWLTVHAERLGPTKARLEVQGKNSRACRFYFDEVQITNVSLTGEGEGKLTLTPSSTSSPGTNESVLRYWSREWGKKFAVELDVNVTKAEDETLIAHEDEFQILRGRVACEWAEYETGMLGLDLNKLEREGYMNPKIPALEEVFRLLPQWAIVSKAADGLVEASYEFVI